jgi:hypothetical protein
MSFDDVIHSVRSDQFAMAKRFMTAGTKIVHTWYTTLNT